MDAQSVSLSTNCSLESDSMDVQGVSLSTTSSSTSDVHGVSILTGSIMDVQGVSLSKASSMDNGHAGGISFHHQQYGRAGFQWWANR